MRNRIIHAFRAIFIPIVLLMLIAACGGSDNDDGGSSSDSNTDDSGGSDITTYYSETTELTSLDIGNDEVLGAPDGYSLTMTVDGVETPMDPGTYTGNIVLTVTPQMYESAQSGPFTVESYYRTAIYIDSSGNYDPDYSVAAAVTAGTYDSSTAQGVNITSIGPDFNGFIIEGGTYTINDAEISLTGNSENDFVGYGFAIKASGSSVVNINRADILNKGVVRGGIWVGDSSTVYVDESTIEVQNGTLPDTVAGMWAIPWTLGATGNARATLVVGAGKAYYTDSTITAQGWGALSTDAVSSGLILSAEDCIINVTESGYGAYADGVANDSFSGCEFNVADYALIQTGGTASFSDGCVVNSDRFGVMMHSSTGTLTVSDSTFNTVEAGLQMKSSSPSIAVSNSTFNSDNGIILMYIYNDDPDKVSCGSSSTATFTNCSDLTGDIINANTGQLAVNVSLENSTLTGSITTGAWTPDISTSEMTSIQASLSSPAAFDPDGAQYASGIGDGTVAYKDPGNTHGINVTLDSDSTWIVSKQVTVDYRSNDDTENTCYLNSLVLEAGASLQAPYGYTLTVTDGGTDVTGSVTGGSGYSSSGKVIITVN